MTHYILTSHTCKALFAGLLLLAFASCEVGTTTKEASCATPTNLNVAHDVTYDANGGSVALNYTWDATSAPSYQVVLTDQDGTSLHSANTTVNAYSHTFPAPFPSTVTASVKGQCSGGTTSSETKLTVRIRTRVDADTVGTVDVDVL